MQRGPCSDTELCRRQRTRHADGPMECASVISPADVTHPHAVDTITRVPHAICAAALSHAVGSIAHLEQQKMLRLGKLDWDELTGAYYCLLSTQKSWTSWVIITRMADPVPVTNVVALASKLAPPARLRSALMYWRIRIISAEDDVEYGFRKKQERNGGETR